MTNLNFDPQSDVPDLSRRVFAITGGTSGIGKTTILRLAARNPAQIIFTGRSAARAQLVIAEASALSPTTKVSFVPCDQADLDSVKDSGREIIKISGGRIDVLICNAAVFIPDAGVTKQGYEVAFGTNHLGNAAIVDVLFPTLMQTSAAADSADVRIVFVSSESLLTAPKEGIAFPLLKTDMAGFACVASGLKRYSQSKLALRLYAMEMAKRYPGVTSVAIHPGKIKTESVGTAPWWTKLFFAVSSDVLTPDEGCYNTLWAATADREKCKLQGGWFSPVGIQGPEIPKEHLNLSEQLWAWTQTALMANGFSGL
ncbi:oxidoreductase [Geranomyces variabilis]|nr:oxidoreductase [Geranomyces variabilis]KAJ3136274.1 hypothetical protein HDU90_003325 [Geranomyces variabilis]